MEHAHAACATSNTSAPHDTHDTGKHWDCGACGGMIDCQISRPLTEEATPLLRLYIPTMESVLRGTDNPACLRRGPHKGLVARPVRQRRPVPLVRVHPACRASRPAPHPKGTGIRTGDRAWNRGGVPGCHDRTNADSLNPPS